MKLTNKQRKELRILKSFTDKEITEDEIAKFFAWSDRGEGKEQYLQESMKGGAPLYWAKNRRDLQITMYKEDWGSTVNAWTFDDEPRWYAEWVSEKLGKPAIKESWYRNRKNYYQRLERAARKEYSIF